MDWIWVQPEEGSSLQKELFGRMVRAGDDRSWITAKNGSVCVEIIKHRSDDYFYGRALPSEYFNPQGCWDETGGNADLCPKDPPIVISRISSNDYDTIMFWAEKMLRRGKCLLRHMTVERFEEKDNDTGLLHAAHAAWNALARLELMLRSDTNGGS